MTQAKASPGARYLYMDFLRVVACFGVIVNHTNSHVFQAEAPGSLTWTLSILWYYLSKTAVPLFVMVSGACLLPRQDSYRRVGQRISRMLLALVLFSYFYHLFDLWKTYWTWERALNLGGFLGSIWQERVTDSFWYLYFYLGLLVMLPLLQRLARAMKQKDYHYLLAISLGCNALWPLLTHYVPGLAFPPYFDLPLFSIYIGLFFLGHYLHTYGFPVKRQGLACGATMALALGFSAFLTLLEAQSSPPGTKYWFMDDRMTPALPVILCAAAVMLLARRAFAPSEQSKSALPPWAVRALTALGSYAFSIYLLQDWLIAETRYRLFVPLCAVVNPFMAALLWELFVFAALLPAAWLLKRMPGLRKIV